MRILVLRPKIALVLILTVLLSLMSYVWHYQIVPSLVRAGTYSMVKTQEKVVALTFDDGPDPAFTEPILDILKKKQVKATFFVIGEAARTNSQLLRRMVKEGHEIGNHGYSHSYNQRKVVDELRRTDEVVYAATGLHTYFYRPPGGFVSKSQLEVIGKNGYVVTLWSVDSRDWRRPGVERVANNVLQNVVPGAIVLFHDGGGMRNQTVEALPKVIDELQASGYRFVTLSELRTLNLET